VGNFVDKSVKLSGRNQIGHSSKHLRFQTKRVGNTVALVSCRGAHLCNVVRKLHDHHPLVHCELNFSCKIMEMADQMDITSRFRGVILGSIVSMQCLVKLGSNREAGLPDILMVVVECEAGMYDETES
jgi:hypothetical protein